MSYCALCGIIYPMNDIKTIVYIAMSTDGYIATAGGGLEWLDALQIPGEDYGYSDFINSISTVVMGRKTYDKVLSFGIPFPHKDRKCYVLSRSRQGADENVTYYNDGPASLIAMLRAQGTGNIFVDGGAETVHALLCAHAIDRLIISVIPVLLGDGVRLFHDGRPHTQLRLLHSATYPTGLVQLWYDMIKEGAGPSQPE